MRYKLAVNRFRLEVRRSFPPTGKMRLWIMLPISKVENGKLMKECDMVHVDIPTICDDLLTPCFLTLTADRLLVCNLIQ